MRGRRISGSRKIALNPPLFPGYCFVTIELQWHETRWAPGTLGWSERWSSSPCS
jgi:hypothetical protein